jgi:outer membrane protein TolC
MDLLSASLNALSQSRKQQSILCTILCLSICLAPIAEAADTTQSNTAQSQKRNPAVANQAASSPATGKVAPNEPLVALATIASASDAKADPKSTATKQPPSSLVEPIVLPSDSSQWLQSLTANHDLNKTMDLKPLYLGSVMRTASARALEGEQRYDQSITLHDALSYALTHGLPLKISKEAYNYQRFQTLANFASALPSFTMSYSLSRANIFNKDTDSQAQSFLAGVSYPVFQGGGILYSILTQYYRERGWHYAYKATVSDVFLDIYQKYINLVLNRVLLQIFAKTVEADEEQLRLNQSALRAGTGTRFAVLQTESQLASDRQALLQQQVTARQSALALNLSLNFPMSINLIPVEETLTEASLFQPNVPLSGLIRDALHFNPSLRQYEMFRLTAARNIQLAAAPLYPTVSFFTVFQHNDAIVVPAQNAADVGGIATASIASALNSTFAGRASNNALGQQQSFSPTAGSTSTQGANTGPLATPAAAGGTPIAVVQSGSLVTSGAVAPSIFGGGNGGSGQNINGSFQAPAGIFPGVFRNFLLGFSISWSLPNAGLSSVANIYTARTLARQALMQCNQELDLVLQQVRSDYLSMINARTVIDKAAYSVASSREALRLARSRFINGISTNLEVIQARRDHISALTSQAQAIVNSNIAQAQLLHDMGMISVSTLTNGYQPGVFADPTRKKKTP